MTQERVEFPSAEKAVIAYLKIALPAAGDDATVGTKRTPATGQRYVRVTRVGGVRDTLVTDRPLITFECWGTDEVDASDLADLTRSLIHSLYGDFVGDVSLSWRSEAGGPAYFPHPDTSAPRYQHTQELTLNGRVAGG